MGNIRGTMIRVLVNTGRPAHGSWIGGFGSEPPFLVLENMEPEPNHEAVSWFRFRFRFRLKNRRFQFRFWTADFRTVCSGLGSFLRFFSLIFFCHVVWNYKINWNKEMYTLNWIKTSKVKTILNLQFTYTNYNVIKFTNKLQCDTPSVP